MNGSTTIVTGIGYLNKTSFGTVNTAILNNYQDLRDIYNFLKEKQILKESIKNFGRFNNESRIACLTAGLALHDAGITSDNSPDDIGLIASNKEGATNANFNYFKDYVDCGRTLGRGNLFIYTLPTSPLAESAICYGLNGPLLYSANDDDSFSFALSEADNILRGNKAHIMLAFAGNDKESLCFVVEKASNRSQNDVLCVKTVVELINNSHVSICETVAGIGQMNNNS